jgi:hypothetical protein
MRLRETVLVQNTSISLQANLAAEAPQADGQILIEGRTSNMEKCCIYREGTRRPAVSKTEWPNLRQR